LIFTAGVPPDRARDDDDGWMKMDEEGWVPYADGWMDEEVRRSEMMRVDG
jgi:hypothetical protein